MRKAALSHVRNLSASGARKERQGFDRLSLGGIRPVGVSGIGGLVGVSGIGGLVGVSGIGGLVGVSGIDGPVKDGAAA